MPPNPAGVIDYFLHPPFGLTTSSTTNPSVITNPLTGLNNILLSTVGLASSFGIVWAVSFAPAHSGHTVNTFKTYEDVAFRAWQLHTLASGLVVISDQFQSSEQNGIHLWNNALPSSIVLDIFPNFELTVEWLVGV